MAAEALDLRRLARGVVRRWWLVAACALVGAVVGIAYAGPQRAVYVAQTRVLLNPSQKDAAGRPLRDPSTESYIVTSAEVLRLASAATTPRLTVDQIRGHLSITSPSTDLLDVRITASSATLASTLANDVARAYVAFSNNPNAAEVEGLRAQATALQERIQQLQARIATEQGGVDGVQPLSPGPGQSTAAVDRLLAQESESEQALTGVEGRINDAVVGTQGENAVRIVDPAVAPQRPVAPPRRRDAAAGALGGVAGGLALALLVHGLDRRPRRRDDIARVVGAPVVTTLRLPRTAGMHRRARHLLQLWEPGPLDRLAVRQALGRIAGGERPVEHLVLVSARNDSMAPLATLQVAIVLAAMGTPTALAVPEGDAGPSTLRILPSEAINGLEAGLRLHTGDELSDERLRSADVIVTALAAGRSPIAIPTWSRRTVVVIVACAGQVTAADLEGAAAACREAGHPVGGVVVVDPEPDDDSSGRLQVTIAVPDPEPGVQACGTRSGQLYGS